MNQMPKKMPGNIRKARETLSVKTKNSFFDKDNNLRGYPIRSEAFRQGFDACWSHLEPVIREMREALEFYGQETVPDINSLFAKSAIEFGENVVTWEPLTDMGNKARQTLAKAKQVLG